MDAGAAQGIDGEFEGGVAEDIEVDDAAEIVDVGGEIVVAVGGGGGEGFGVGDAFYFGQIIGDELVGSVLDPLGGGRCRRGRRWVGCT